MNIWKATSGLTVVMIVAGATPAYAYLDPGTGAMITQALIGGIAIGLVTIRSRWATLKARISGLFS